MSVNNWRQLGRAVVDISKISAIKSADQEAEQYRLCLLLDRVELELAHVTRDEIADLFGVFNLNCAPRSTGAWKRQRASHWASPAPPLPLPSMDRH